MRTALTVCILAITGALAWPAHAQRAVEVVNLEVDLVPTLGATNQNLTVSSVATNLAALASATDAVLVTVDTADLWVTFDGTAPVAITNGILMRAGTSGLWSARLAAAARFIRSGGTDAMVRCVELARP